VSLLQTSDVERRTNGTAPTPAITVEGVSKRHGRGPGSVVALDGISLTVGAGEIVCLVGASGCGKSTLLNLMGLLDVPSKGKVEINGAHINGAGDAALAHIRNREIGFIFQTFHLVSDLSVLDNVQIPLLYRKMSNGERRKLAEAALDRVGLSARLHHFPSQLSGGQQQRVAIARAVVGRPAILLADEPTGNLDSHMGDEVMALLKDLNQGDQTTIVMVTHDAQKAQQTARTVRLFDGRQVC
jgi:putative ABC transport system ATP-binding protein